MLIPFGVVSKGPEGEVSMSTSLRRGPPAVPTRRDGPCRYGGQPRLLRALPDLVVRVADAGLGVGIALDLDLELEGLPDQAGLGGVRDGLLEVVAVERVGAPVVVRDLARLGVGLGDALVLSREVLVVAPGLGRLFHIIGCAGKGPGPELEVVALLDPEPLGERVCPIGIAEPLRVLVLIRSVGLRPEGEA